MLPNFALGDVSDETAELPPNFALGDVSNEMAEFPPHFALGDVSPETAEFPSNFALGTFPTKRLNFHRISHSGRFRQNGRTNPAEFTSNFTLEDVSDEKV
ncbi:MAG: hypothetical protein Q8881_04005 [Sweet potato little leaf phytoplasma]|nr:hypothetical protein [Sweet potato little leaf phytoplasma]